MNRILFFLFIIITSIKAFAQESDKNISNQYCIWLRYYNKFSLGQRWQLHSEWELREFVSTGRLYQWVLPRLHLHYSIREDIDVGAGACYFLHALPQEADQEVEMIRQEIRPHQEINTDQNLGRIKLSHRYKAEERFFVRTADDAADFIFRLRYKCQVQLSLGKISGTPLALVLYDEVMFNWGNGVSAGPFDQNRIFAALLFRMSESWSVETGYMNLFQQRSSPHNFYNRHILRMTFNHNVK